MAEFSSLCPGYKQVEAFGAEEEYEEEEVSYVTFDLGNVDPTLLPSSSSYRLIGLDTPAPFLQLSGTVFKGRHDTLLGTELLFTDGKDAVDWSKRTTTHVANTEQRVCFKEVQLKAKKQTPATEVRDEADGVKVDRLTGKAQPVVKERKRRAVAQPARKSARKPVGADSDVQVEIAPQAVGKHM